MIAPCMYTPWRFDDDNDDSARLSGYYLYLIVSQNKLTKLELNSRLRVKIFLSIHFLLVRSLARFIRVQLNVSTVRQRRNNQ